MKIRLSEFRLPRKDELTDMLFWLMVGLPLLILIPSAAVYFCLMNGNSTLLQSGVVGSITWLICLGIVCHMLGHYDPRQKP